MAKKLRSAKVVELSRAEARELMRRDALPRGHATLNEILTSANTVYHIEGTPDHDFRIYR